MNEPQWAIAYSTASRKRWYRIVRVISADDKWFELYWHHDASLRSDSLERTRARAQAAGLAVLPLTFRDAPAPRQGSQLIPN